jgi:phosphoribosylaminoimidazole carboxylase PurE protein
MRKLLASFLTVWLWAALAAGLLGQEKAVAQSESVSEPVIAAAGDIACAPPATRTSTKCHQRDTASLLAAGSYDAVLPVGDTQYDCGGLSAFYHRSPRDVADYAASAEDRGLEVIIAAAGRSAALPGMIAAHTILPVIGLPIFTPQLAGADALYSMVQMPSGVPVATVGLDAAANAGILAVQILAVGDPALRKQLHDFKKQLAEGLRL